MLCSSEVLYGITNAHIEKLEQVDRIFFRKLFKVPNSTAIEAFYLETSSIPIRHILMGRRLLYLWNILNRNESELVRRVFDSQKALSVRNDWAIQVKRDLEECEISLTELEISKMKRLAFKKLVTEKIQHLAAKYLISLKHQHSKSDNLKYSTSMQPYLKSETLKIEEKKLMFRLRNRLIDVKLNFRKKYSGDLKCRLCKVSEESQAHLLNCSVVLNDEQVKSALEGYTYNHLFSTNLDIQAHMIYVFQRIMKLRSKILKSETLNEDSSSQASPDISGASYTTFV